MKQFRNVTVLAFCSLLIMSSTLFAMSGKKVSGGGGARDVASDSSGRDIASEEHESKGVPQLISYDELKKLSPEQRSAYIEGIRGMLLELSAKGAKGFPLFADGRAIQEKFSFLEALLPAANAEYVNSGSDPSEIRPRYLRNQYLNNYEKWTCDSDQADFNYQIGTCVKKGGKLATVLVDCPSGYRSAYLANNVVARLIGSPMSKYCVPEASWQRLSPQRRTELQNKTGAQSVDSYFAYRIDGQADNHIGAEVALGNNQKVSKVPGWLAVPTKDELRAKTSGDGNGFSCESKNPGVIYNLDIGTCTSKEVSNKSQCPASDWQYVTLAKDEWGPNNTVKHFCVTPASWQRLSAKRQRELTEPTPGKLSNTATAQDREDAATAKNYASVTVELPPARPAKGKDAAAPASAQASAPKSNERAPSQDIALGGAPCAAVSQPSCPTKDSKEHNDAEEWYRKNIDSCIYGGFASNFRSGKNAAKNCQAVTSISKPRLSCATGVLCNPIVFSVKEDGKPFCALKNDGRATADCNEQSTAGNKKEWLSENIDNVKDEWNKLRAGMDKSCGRNLARQYFCEECNIMMERLESLRVLARVKDDICHAPLMSVEDAANALKPAAPAQGTKQ